MNTYSYDTYSNNLDSNNTYSNDTYSNNLGGSDAYSTGADTTGSLSRQRDNAEKLLLEQQAIQER
jgi:hypothetical protein